jgi:mannose-6-phosphate isomerase-like protein (cupin superfamily)
MEELRPFKVKLQAEEARQHIFGRSPETFGLRSGAVILRPEESVGEHTTDQREEAIVILEGTAEISLGRQAPLNAEKDYIVYIPPNTPHDVKNTGTDLLRYIYITSPVKNKDG